MNTTELRRLLSQATPGPWEVLRDNPECHLLAVLMEEEEDGETPSYVALADVETRTNAALIAAAVNALPALIAAVEAAEHWRNAYESNDPSNESFELMCAALDALREV